MTDLASLTADQLAEKVRTYCMDGRTVNERGEDALAELISRARRLKTAEDALDMLWAHYLLPISDEQKAQVLAAIRPNPKP